MAEAAATRKRRWRFPLPRGRQDCYGKGMINAAQETIRTGLTKNTPRRDSDRGPRRSLRRRLRKILAAAIILHCSGATVGCGSLWKSRQGDENEALQSLLVAPKPPESVGIGTDPIGLQPLLVVGVGAVNSLSGTGGAPDPSESRDLLIENMKRHDVPNCEAFIEQDSTALVQVEALIPPGARRGDVVDARVICPDDARASDLAGGWLLDCRLHQQLRVRGGAISGPSLRKGDCLAITTGPVTTVAAYENSSDPSDRVDGRIIGGGQVQQDRPIGLAVRKSFVHHKIAAAIADAVSERFFFFDGNSRKGIATATTESQIDLQIPPRYQNSIDRLIAVIDRIAVSPKKRQSQAYLQSLGVEMDSVKTAGEAALKLEALGESAVPILLEKIKSENQEIRFYAAEALAYLDRYEAVDILIQTIQDEPSMRAPAFFALRDMKDPRVDDALEPLLDVASVETRYGAFVTLRDRRKLPQRVQSQSLGTFDMHRMAAGSEFASPVVIASIHDQRDFVIMSSPIAVNVETFFRDKRGLMIKSIGKDRLSVQRYSVDQPDRQSECDATVSGLIETLRRVGLTYGEVMTVLQQAKSEGAIDAPFAIDPLPKTKRLYYRDDAA